ncbi:hypothetical protein ACIHDR_07070 [Nocardia sp. NPDC052278]|uniref:hypothetical protein n=1 Tax=unclassified Nocardia TaxID=2637762 RepID=UPI0036C11546
MNSEVRAWGKPVGYQLLRDVSYGGYARTVNVRADKLNELRPCLQRLVPMIQRATAQYRADPPHVNDVVVDVVSKNPKYSPYSAEPRRLRLGGAHRRRPHRQHTDGVIGSFDEARVQRVIDEFAPILRRGGANVPSNRRAEDIVTKELLDPTITIGS